MAEPTRPEDEARAAGPDAPAALPVAPPAAPRVTAARLRALTGLLILAALTGGVWLFGYWEPRLLPVRVIEVQGELHHHSSELLQKTIGERLSGGILTADLEDLKQAAEDLAWVGRASLRRVWPDRLQVRVDEHKPAARWGRDGLVTADGLVFRPRTGTVPAGLPILEGEEKRAPALVSRYLKWRDELMLAGQLIDTLSVDARGAWRLDLVSGTRLELGTGDIEQRLQRFIGASAQLEAAGQAEAVDLRYRNGFAVRWAPGAASQPEPEPAQAGAPIAGATGAQATLRKAAKTGRSAKGPKSASGLRSVKGPKSVKGGKTAKSARVGAPVKKTPKPAMPAKAAPRAKSAVPAGSPPAGKGAPGRATAGAPVTERSVTGRSVTGRTPAERKLQAQAGRKAAERNL